MTLGSALQGVLGLGVGKAAELSESVQKAYAQVAQQSEGVLPLHEVDTIACRVVVALNHSSSTLAVPYTWRHNSTAILWLTASCLQYMSLKTHA